MTEVHPVSKIVDVEHNAHGEPPIKDSEVFRGEQDGGD